MHRETPDKYTVLLHAGILELEMPGGGWHAVHDGLRDVVIKAALTGKYAIDVRKAVRKRRRILFKDEEHQLLLRWSPCGVH
jgi:hypothetical protein